VLLDRWRARLVEGAEPCSRLLAFQGPCPVGPGRLPVPGDAISGHVSCWTVRPTGAI